MAKRIKRILFLLTIVSAFTILIGCNNTGTSNNISHESSPTHITTGVSSNTTTIKSETSNKTTLSPTTIFSPTTAISTVTNSPTTKEPTTIAPTTITSSSTTVQATTKEAIPKEGFIIDNEFAKSSDLSSSISLPSLSEDDVEEINSKLNIAYFHTSHGSQIREGMNIISSSLTKYYILNESIIFDNYIEGGEYLDAGLNYYSKNDYKSLYDRTIEYLIEDEKDGNIDTNVVIWAWCGQLCWMTTKEVNDYLSKMVQLESEYPNIRFVYMTGHAFNSDYYLTNNLGVSGTKEINSRNNQLIREYCTNNNKVLFDFEKMDMYDPSNNYFGSKNVRDDTSYDSDNDGSFDGSWSKEWAESECLAGRLTETESQLLYQIGAYHTTYLNSICKAYAFWNLLSMIAKQIK